MTDLPLGVLAIGALAVTAVVLYNRGQERVARRDAEQAFGAGHADVLLGAERREPALAPRREAVPPELRRAVPAERIDYVIELTLPNPLAPPIVHEASAPTERRFARRALLAVDGVQVRAALPLVTRNGVVGEAEGLEFRALGETMAAALAARGAAPEMREALEAARGPDRPCAPAHLPVAPHVV